MATSKRSTTRFSSQPRFLLPGSEKAPAPQPPELKATAAKPPAPRGKVTVSVVVKRKEPLPPAELGSFRMTRPAYRQKHGPDPAAVKLVRAFAAEFGLTVADGDPRPGQRVLHLSGLVPQMQKAFSVTLDQQTIDGTMYRVREGGIHLPAELEGHVEAVLGLDNRPQAKPHFRVAAGPDGAVRPRAAAADPSFTPVQIAQLYQFPSGASGAGQTIGLIELGGGYRTADLTAYFKTLGLAAPSVTAVSVDGGKNAPSTASSADGEVMLDIEVAAAVAPGAAVAVYFAPNTDQGFIDAIAAAVHDATNKPGVISISWGGPESSWTAQALTALDDACQSAAALGITITVAAGDNGSSDGATGNIVDFPASSPHVLACGGTTITATNGALTGEVVWNEQATNQGATGGGVSSVFALPTWQANSNVPAPPQAGGGRGVPDISGDADPASGYVIRVDGQTVVIGGTSAVAPLWAGLITVANAQNKRTAGFINPALYAANAGSAFHDITQGNNGSFSAAVGWDACTGLGSPIGTGVVALLGGVTGGSSGGGAGSGGKKGKQPKKPVHKHRDKAGLRG